MPPPGERDAGGYNRPVPRVQIPAPYRGPTQGVGEVDVAGATVRECIDAVAARYPGFGDQVYDAAGSLHRFVQLFLNGDELGPDALEAPVGPDDRVEILAAIAGG